MGPSMNSGKKAGADRARSEATAKSWDDEEVRSERMTRHTCTVTCDGVTTEHSSVFQGFKAYDLPEGRHIPFRKKAKKNGVAIFEHKGKLYEFRTFLKTTGSQGSECPTTLGGKPPRVAPDLIGEALKDAEKQDLASEQNAAIDTEQDGRVRTLRAVVMRRGQKEFRDELLEAYAGRCAITQCAAIDVLEAAHIVPYRGAHTHRIDNGLLLRSDIHTLFDLGLLWIEPTSMCVEIAGQLFSTEYEAFRGRLLFLPQNSAHHPRREHLQHHANIARRISVARSKN